jgi:HD domain
VPPEPFLPVWDAAEPYLRARKNDVHVPLSYGFADDLLELHETADRDVVLLAVILHDLGWAVVDQAALGSERLTADMLASELRLQHEREGARLAREILAGLEFERDLIEEVAAIIDGHDTRLHALSLNDELVKDADKLWRYTTTGVSVGCDLFGANPAEYAAWIGDRLDDVIFTAPAKAIARRELALTRRQLRLDILS